VSNGRVVSERLQVKNDKMAEGKGFCVCMQRRGTADDWVMEKPMVLTPTQ
jgi:hypothetical protein